MHLLLNVIASILIFFNKNVKIAANLLSVCSALCRCTTTFYKGGIIFQFWFSPRLPKSRKMFGLKRVSKVKKFTINWKGIQRNLLHKVNFHAKEETKSIKMVWKQCGVLKVISFMNAFQHNCEIAKLFWNFKVDFFQR